ncbi:MAG: hypothetical protein ACRCVI_01550 [Mycoplasmoidaceae bacterium]
MKLRELLLAFGGVALGTIVVGTSVGVSMSNIIKDKENIIKYAEKEYNKELQAKKLKRYNELDSLILNGKYDNNGWSNPKIIKLNQVEKMYFITPENIWVNIKLYEEFVPNTDNIWDFRSTMGWKNRTVFNYYEEYLKLKNEIYENN